MSYQAQIFVCDLRGCSRGEKAVLNVLARYHDSRTGICRVSQAQIAADAEMSERHIIALCQGLEARRVIERVREHMGRGAITHWRLVEMDKGEIASPLSTCERVKSGVEKGEICAEKGEEFSPPNKERKKNQVLRKPHPNPPLQGGNPDSTFHLKRRDHTRLARAIDKLTRPSEASVGTAGNYTWNDSVREACVELLIPFEDAIHDLLLMDREVWSARFDIKKPAQAAIGT